MSTDKHIELFNWSNIGGNYFHLVGQVGIVILIKWSSWAIGFEIFKKGIIFFIGPFNVGIGTAR